MKYLIVLLSILLFSCGTRKVDRHSKSSVEEINTSIQEQTQVTELQFDRKKVFEIMRELNIRNGSITFNTDGSITAKGDEIDLNSKEAGEESESGTTKEENKNININQNSNKSDDENDVKIDRRQFNWFGLVLFIGLILLLINFDEILNIIKRIKKHILK